MIRHQEGPAEGADHLDPITDAQITNIVGAHACDRPTLMVGRDPLHRQREYCRAWWGLPDGSVPGGKMPIDWPSRTGKGMTPKSSTMWWVSLDVPASVTRWLPATVAVIGFRGP